MGRKKGKKLFNSVKRVVQGIEFDSITESRFFVYLTNNAEAFDILKINVHPKFVVIKPFELTCWKCQGSGKMPSPKTGKEIQCKRCKGTGKKSRKGSEYTPDFQVIHKDGTVCYYDVKGFTNERFGLVKMGFESVFGHELIVVKWDDKNKKWIYK